MFFKIPVMQRHRHRGATIGLGGGLFVVSPHSLHVPFGGRLCLKHVGDGGER